MRYDLVISGGTIITAEDTYKADIGIRNGVIMSVGEHLTGEEVMDARGSYVIPGGIDPHVHLNMPAGKTISSDNWETGTKAAACGGTTTVIDFVEPGINQLLQDAWQSRCEEAAAGSIIDFGLHMTITNAEPETLGQISGMIDVGVTSFKLYTTYKGLSLNDNEMLKVMDTVHLAGGIVLVHSESDEIIQSATSNLVQEGKLGPSSHPISRPPSAEEKAVNQVLTLAKMAEVPVYIVHISTFEAASAVAEAVNRGQPAWGETCPQYLVLSEEKYFLPGFEGAKYVCSPPLRAKYNLPGLWKYLGEGKLHSIGTDHCPFNYHGQKELGWTDFRSIPGGLPGIQSRLEIIHSYGVVSGKINPNQWVQMCSTNPAHIFGLQSRKGTIKPGLDADLVIFDPNIEKTITQKGLCESVDYTPYEGIKLRGAVRTTIAGGKIIASDGVYIGNDHKGKYLPRMPYSESL